MGFSLPSASWLLKLPIYMTKTRPEIENTTSSYAITENALEQREEPHNFNEKVMTRLTLTIAIINTTAISVYSPASAVFCAPPSAPVPIVQLKYPIIRRPVVVIICSTIPEAALVFDQAQPCRGKNKACYSSLR